MLPVDLSGGKPVDKNEEGGCDENDDVPEEMMLGINFTLKELSEMFLDTESTEDKSLETNPGLKRSMAIHCHIEKSSLQIIIYMMKRRQALLKLILIVLF